MIIKRIASAIASANPTTKVRAEANGMASQLSTLQGGDVVDMPSPLEGFSAIIHNDVQCCVEDKLTVLRECSRAINADAWTCFTVIRLADGSKRTSMDRTV